MTSIGENPAARAFVANQFGLNDSIGKIASGSRIPKASDDAAALAISAVLKGDDVVLDQGARNAAQGAAVAQVADGGLSRISDGLTRLKELAAKAQSGVNTPESLKQINAEFVQIRDEITDIAQQTRFNGESLLDNTDSKDFQVGTAPGDTLELQNVDATSSGLGISGLTLENPGDAAAALGNIDAAIDRVSEARADIGASVSRFESRFENIAVQREATQAANSSLADLDLAEQVSRLVSLQTQSKVSAFVSAQANTSAQHILRVLD